MPKQKSDFLIKYPFRVEFQVNVFAPGEYVPRQPREFSYKTPTGKDEKEAQFEETKLSEEEKERLLMPRGETQKINAVSAIYYDAAQDPEEPDWVLLEDDDIQAIILKRESA